MDITHSVYTMPDEFEEEMKLQNKEYLQFLTTSENKNTCIKSRTIYVLKCKQNSDSVIYQI